MRQFTQTTQRLFSQSVVLNFKDLKAGKNLEADIERAYGPKGKIFYNI
jgi:hypothetical protein